MPPTAESNAEPSTTVQKPDMLPLTVGKAIMSHALSGLSNRKRSDSEDSWSSSALPTPEIVEKTMLELGTNSTDRQGSGLGNRNAPPITSSQGESTAFAEDGNKTASQAAKPPNQSGSNRTRQKSVQVFLEKSSQAGLYTLQADDPELRQIIQSGIEREARKMKSPSRTRFRDLAFTRQFTTFDRQNPRSAQSPFHGFFVLFWLAMALLLCKIAAQNYRNTGSVLGRAEILHLMVDRDLLLVGITDGVMALATGVGYLLQKAIARGYLSWSRWGWIIQSVWEVLYTGSVIGLTFYRNWPWTHTVFIVLHVFVLLMKQHSYAFYNGYLSQVYRRKKLLEHKTRQLEEIDPIVEPVCSSDSSKARTTGAALASDDCVHWRKSSGPKASTNLQAEESEVSVIAQAIRSSSPLDASQLRTFQGILRDEISILCSELQGNISRQPGASQYPHNLTLSNFFDWTSLPTLVYELEYPRQETINWWYVAEKSAATLGVIWIMIVISQAYIYPVVMSTMQQKAQGMPLEQRWREFPWVVSDMLFPLLLEQLLAWYAIWECLLNVLAEVTRFADRGFYGDWWNSVSYADYARDWNRPVHTFLLRHVYHSSISALRLSKTEAMFGTFLLSALVHEVLMVCLFQKVRGYLFLFQLSQIPLAAMTRWRVFKGREVLGNILFWLGLFIGPSLITGLYLVI